jgi:hypothetical protein
MQKLKLQIDVTKIEKDKIIPRTYINKGGVEVTVKDLNLEVVPLKEKKFIKDTEKGTLYKTHFVAHASTKNDDGTWNNGSIIGDGITFEPKGDNVPPQAREDGIKFPDEDINPDDIPF